MSYASQVGRARVSPSNPQALAVCDRCSMWYNGVDLRPQIIVAGATLIPINILVCRECFDVPNETTRAIVLPADPVPVVNPRVEPFYYDETTDTTTFIGQPVGLQQAAIMPLYGTVHYGVELPMLSVIADGSTTVAMTFSAAHGLDTNDQISVEGLSARNACGFFSVAITTATAITYVTATAVTAGSLLTDTSKTVTALVGLPLGVTQIPQVTT